MCKVVIVTGGSGLIGRAIVDSLLLENYVVCNLDLFDFKCTHDNYFYYALDLTKKDDVERVVDSIVTEKGGIFGLINNAYPRTRDWGLSFEDIPLESWRLNVDMQLNGLFYITQKTLSYMSRQRTGSIVNMSSIYGVVGNDMSLYEGTTVTPPAAYSAIKGGTINFTRYLASKYGPLSIRVNCVSPGGIFDNQHAEFVNRYESRVPMKRMGKPSDIAPVVTFLLSSGSGYITGQNIIVDGGWTAI